MTRHSSRSVTLAAGVVGAALFFAACGQPGSDFAAGQLPAATTTSTVPGSNEEPRPSSTPPVQQTSDVEPNLAAWVDQSNDAHLIVVDRAAGEPWPALTEPGDWYRVRVRYAGMEDRPYVCLPITVKIFGALPSPSSRDPYGPLLDAASDPLIAASDAMSEASDATTVTLPRRCDRFKDSPSHDPGRGRGHGRGRPPSSTVPSTTTTTQP